MATQVFEVEVEVPDGCPKFYSRLKYKTTKEGDYFLALLDDGPALTQIGDVSTPALVAVQFLDWRPAKPADLADQLRGKKLRWRFRKYKKHEWFEGACVGYIKAKHLWIDDKSKTWHFAEVLDAV